MIKFEIKYEHVYYLWTIRNNFSLEAKTAIRENKNKLLMFWVVVEVQSLYIAISSKFLKFIQVSVISYNYTVCLTCNINKFNT